MHRMISSTITDSDKFINMKSGAQVLYIHLNMHADDDGFVSNVQGVRRMVRASEKSLKELIDKGYVILFDSGVAVITHWLIHNKIRNDRYRATQCEEEKAMLTLVKRGSYKIYQLKSEKSNFQPVEEIPVVEEISTTQEIQPIVEEQTPIVETPPPLSEEEKKFEEYVQYRNKQIQEKQVAGQQIAEAFKECWELYPKKVGELDAQLAFTYEAKRQSDLQEFTEKVKSAIQKYKNYIESSNIEDRYIKEGKTYFTQKGWNDTYTVKQQENEVDDQFPAPEEWNLLVNNF